jgi:hypothetical protein
MQTITNYKIDGEILFFKDKTGFHRVALDVGEGDDIYIFREVGITYALAINTHFGHVGIQSFEGGDETGRMFLQKESQLTEVIGKQWYNMTPMTIVRRMAFYI